DAGAGGMVKQHHPAARCPPPMSILRTCTLFVFAAWCGPAAAFPLPALDRHGDLLQAGVRSRLGTTRLRASCDELRFSADGQTLVGIDNLRAYRWDAGTGRLVDVRPLPVEGTVITRLSADGKTAVFTSSADVGLADPTSGARIDLRSPPKFNRIEAAAVSD